MRYEITSPDGKRFEVTAPEGASQDDVIEFAKKQFEVRQHKPVSATEGMSGGAKFFAGMGKGIVDAGRGLGQRLGDLVSAPSGAELAADKDVAEARQRDAPLMDSGAGVAGNVAGSLMTLAPTLAVPGANTVAGATAIGALSGAARPTIAGESAAKNIATDAALGGVSQWGLGKVAEHFAGRMAAIKEAAMAKMAQNAVKDEGIAGAREAGYSTIPSVSGGNMPGRIIEGLTGTEKAKQMASVKNQPVTDSIARKALELGDDAQLTHETMRGARQAAIERGYDPVRQVPFMETDDAFRKQISKLTSRSDSASKDFGALVESDVKPLAEGLKDIKGFTGDSAVDAVSIFREKASDLYAQGNRTLGKAYREAAEAIEGQIERGLTAQGGDGAALLKDYRAARTKVAQTFDLEKALREGQGSIDARVLGRLYAANPDRMSGGIAQIGKAASSMGDVMQVPKAGWSNPVTALDSGVSMVGSIMAGNPLPLAYPAARAAARYGLMTEAGQRAFATPQYGPGVARTSSQALLEALKERAAGASAGSIYATQE